MMGEHSLGRLRDSEEDKHRTISDGIKFIYTEEYFVWESDK